MGMWIVAKARQGKLNLESFEALLSNLPQVTKIEPKTLKNAQARKLQISESAHSRSAPITEWNSEEIVFYVHWGDNVNCHLSHLAARVLESNELCGTCYDGYKHPDNQAVKAWLKHAGLTDLGQDPETISNVLEGALLGQKIQFGEDYRYEILHFDSFDLYFEEEDWSGPNAHGLELASIAADWQGRVTFNFQGGEQALLQAKSDDWTLRNKSGKEVLLSRPNRPILLVVPLEEIS